MLYKITIPVLLLFLAGSPATASDPPRPAADPNASVVELWYLGGDGQPQPEVAVLGDGRVWCRCAHGPHWGQMTPEELRELLNELLYSCDLARCHSQALMLQIQQESVRTGLTADVPGAADTFIRIRTDGREYQVRCPAVGVLAPRFPEATSVQQVFRAQRRLENLRAVTMAGGGEAAARLAQLAQQSVASEHGQSIRVTPGDLAMVRFLPDGGRYCQFLITPSMQNPHGSHIISLFDTPGNAPRVTLLGDGPTFR